MKHILYLLVALLSVPIWGQELPPPREIDPEYRKEYRQDVKEEKKVQRDLERDGWDIVLPPEEKVPVQLYDQLPPTSADNWGVRLLLPQNLRQRIARECTHQVVLKITDTGVDVDHPDLIGGWRMAGTNYTTSPSIDDIQGHGTHVAGIAAAQNFGLAYELAQANLLRLKSVKILGDQGSGSFGWVANAYRSERAQDLQLLRSGVGVVYNGSFGGGTAPISAVEAELKTSSDAGVVFVFAAGNSNGPVNYPALSDYALTISSLDQNLRRSSFSCFGPEVNLAKPGRSITSTYPGGRYATLSGTSMASPFGAGIVCLAISKWGLEKLPDYNAVRDYLEQISYDLGEEGHDDLYGSGITYVSAVLDKDPSDYLDDNPPPPPPPPPAPGEDVTVTTTYVDPVLLAYRTQEEHDNDGGGNPLGWKTIVITEMTCQATTDQSALYIHDEMDRLFNKYWYELGKAMVIPDDETAAESIDYAARFFYFWTREQMPIFISHVVGYDAHGRRFEWRRTDEKYGGVESAEDLSAKMIFY